METTNNQIFGITLGDSSGIGPEIVLNAFRKGEIRQRCIVFGDLAVLDYCNRRLGYGVALRAISEPGDWAPQVLNVRDFGIVQGSDVTPGRINAKSGAAAREYVIAAAKAALRAKLQEWLRSP